MQMIHDINNLTHFKVSVDLFNLPFIEWIITILLKVNRFAYSLLNMYYETEKRNRTSSMLYCLHIQHKAPNRHRDIKGAPRGYRREPVIPPKIGKTKGGSITRENCI